MFISLVKNIFRDKKSATAVAMAIMTVPLIIAASAAVDFSRIASARTLLQAATDGAAIAGVSEWAMSESSTSAYNITGNEFSNTGMQLPNFVSETTPVITLICGGTTGTSTEKSNQCGGTQSFSNKAVTGCLTDASGILTVEYCIAITETATLKNTLFAWLIPSELLTVRSVASWKFPPNVTSGVFPPSNGVLTGGDHNRLTAYGVPMTGSGGTPNFNQTQPPNTYCSTASAPLEYQSFAAPQPGVTSCNYLFLGDSLNQSGPGGSLALQQNQPIAFLFSNETGANNYEQSLSESTELLVSTSSAASGYTSYPLGDSIDTYTYTITTTTITCKSYYTSGSQKGQCSNQSSKTSSAVSYSSGTEPTAGNSSTTCTTTYGSGTYKGSCEYSTYTTTSSSTVSTTALTSQCPDHNLYGSLSQGYNTPVSDSLDQYSSAYEALGEPPTYNTNRILTPFISTAVTNTVNATTYYVEAVCPNYPLTNSGKSTGISAPISSAYSSMPGNQDFAGTNAFSTWFAGAAVEDSPAFPATDDNGNAITTGNGDVFPPAVSGCTANAVTTETSSGALTNWNWSGSNVRAGYCQSAQTANYSNCALLIQQIGTNVPVDNNNVALLPDYYLTIEDSGGNVLMLDPVYDGITYVDLLTGVTIKNTNQAQIQNSSGVVTTEGYTPTNSGATTKVITSSTPISVTGSTPEFGTGSPFLGDIIVTQEPASNGTTTDHNLPLATSSKCYDASVAIEDKGYQPVNSSVDYPGYNANGYAIDPIANPQFGAIYCDTPSPETYVLYWNDDGTYEEDDLGYWNATQTFTCSVPPATNAGGGPATLSG